MIRLHRRLHAVLACILLAGLVVAHLAAARDLFRSYGFTYSWTELLINDQGGFSKRALLGEIAFRMQHVIAPRRLIVDAVAGAYILAVAGEIVLLRLAEGYAGLLFLLSPAGGLFPLLNPGYYGRKDCFVLLALVAGMTAAARARRRAVALFVPMAVFAVTGLVVEIAWFYYPLVFATTLALREDEPVRWRLGAAAAAACYTAGCLALTLAAPHVDTAGIARSWSDLREVSGDSGALCCLNIRLGDAIGLARATLPNLGGYALGLLAGLLPLALLLVRHPPRRADALTHAAALAGIVFAMAPLSVATDWGRYIVLWLTATFLWAWTVTRPRVSRAVRTFHVETIAIRGALLMAYAGTWQVAAYQVPEASAFLPGAIFQAVGSAAPDLP